MAHRIAWLKIRINVFELGSCLVSVGGSKGKGFDLFGKLTPARKNNAGECPALVLKHSFGYAARFKCMST